MRWLRRHVLPFARGVVSGASIATVAVLAAALFAGGSNVSVLSGSMEPALSTGDLAIGLPISPADVRPGQVITYTDPGESGKLVTHRVRRVALRGDRAELITQGDANRSAETWSMPADGELRRVVAHIPLAGYGLAAASGAAGPLVLLAFPGLLLLVHMLLRIWRPIGAAEAVSRVPG